MSEITQEEQNAAEEMCKKFTELDIKYEEYFHSPANTMEDLMKYIGDVKGGKCKNLLLKDKKKNGIYLVTALAETKVSLKTLNKKLGNLNLRMADDEILQNLLSVKAGSVTPLALIHDTQNKVTLVLDDDIKKEERVSLHPMHNKCSWMIQLDDLLKFCEHIQHTPIWFNFNDEESSDSVEGGKSCLSQNLSNLAISSEASSASPSASSSITDAAMLGITVKKEENFAEWYTQIVTRSEMIEYYDISGCYILRPWAFHIWETVQSFFDKEIKKLGVENSYFPMFVSRNKLEAEKEHVEGFSPEVAWVCKYGDSDLAEPIAIRPTSETIMYPAYAKWIRSHRDLPLCLNMWNAVVRWEFKQPTPFIRTREFLWQEGHTAHVTKDEALEMVLKILELYRRWYEECLAVPVIKGWKTENEKFAGGDKTSTIEGYIAENGRGIQAATSHLLGINFAKMFNIVYEDKEGNKQYAWQTSWGCTTRSIGVMTMTHGDNKGLVLPPKVASLQVVIIPITYKDDSDDQKLKCDEIKILLEEANVRVKIDNRSNYTPGWKYNHWELKGVPIRIEIGAKDMMKKSVRVIRRDNFEKIDVPWEGLVEKIKCILSDIQNNLFNKAKFKLEKGIVKVEDFNDVMPALNNKKIILAPWCGIKETEDEIRKETQKLSEAQALSNKDGNVHTGGMKSLCIPFDQPLIDENTKCFYTKKPATCWVLWGRSY